MTCRMFAGPSRSFDRTEVASGRFVARTPDYLPPSRSRVEYGSGGSFGTGNRRLSRPPDLTKSRSAWAPGDSTISVGQRKANVADSVSTLLMYPKREVETWQGEGERTRR